MIYHDRYYLEFGQRMENGENPKLVLADMIYKLKMANYANITLSEESPTKRFGFVSLRLTLN